ncbi:unnamed protein product, partial [Choristocarpus tenellus]
KVREFFVGALSYADVVAIAVGGMEGATSEHAQHGIELAHDVARVAREVESETTLQHAATVASKEIDQDEGEVPCRKLAIRVIPVTPWGNFVPALNALLSFAANSGVDLILFQSLETSASPKTIASMTRHLGPRDLVVGVALQGHAFSEGQGRELTGVTTPWNTLAMWDVGKLARIG